jgi:hypothetical protein
MCTTQLPVVMVRDWNINLTSVSRISAADTEKRNL